MTEQYILSNGMRVIMEKIPHVHSAAFGIWVHAGSADETEEINGMAHMLEHMVFKGTKKRTTARIAEDTAQIGGNINAYTSKEFTSYYAWVLKENLPKAIELLGDMLLNSRFRPEDLEKEKSIVMEEIEMYKDSPEDVVHEMLQRSVWDKHPLGWLISGEKEIVEEFKPEALHEFRNAYYTAENMVLSIAGSFDMEETKKLLEEAFAAFPKVGRKKSDRVPQFRSCVYTEEKDIGQIHLNLAYSSITSLSSERYAFSVLNAILGGGVNSRLFLKIREEMGITYSIYSYGSTFEKAGLLHLYAGLNPRQLEPALEVMGREVRLLKSEGPSSNEMLWAKEQIKTDLIIHGESTKGHMNSNARELIQFGRVVSLEETLEKIDKVSRADIMHCLQCYFEKEKMAFALAGNIEETESVLLSLDVLKQYF